LAATAAVTLTAPAGAQPAYPAKTVQIVVPFTAGGGADVVVRAVAQRLAKQWSANIVIDNRAGASGMIGTELVAKAPPDGHTLLGHTSGYPAAAAIRKTLPFDPAHALLPVATIARAPLVFAVHPSVPAKSVTELVALARRHPGKLNYSSAGTGGNNHFATALFASSAKVSLTHVPYKGVAQATVALVSGEVELLFASLPALGSQLRSGRLRALGVTTEAPTALLPGVPAIAQAGLPGYAYELWWALFAPAGLAAERVSFINAAVNGVIAAADLRGFLADQGTEPWPQSPAQLRDLLPREIARYRAIAQSAGIQAE